MPFPSFDTCAVGVDGKLYVLGDFNHSANNNANHVYDPLTALWTVLAPIPTGRGQSGAAAVDGRIFYIAGNNCYSNCFVATHEAYNIAENTWSGLPALPGNNRASVSSAAVDGKIYVMGGTNSYVVPTFDYNYMYDPVANTWTSKAPLPRPRAEHKAVVLNDRIYLIGGTHRYVHGVLLWNPEVDVYDPATDTWSEAAALPYARTELCAVAARGKIYAIGGSPRNESNGQRGAPTSLVEEYDPVINTWRTVAPLPAPRHLASAAVIEDTIYVIGGSDGSTHYATVFKGTLELADCDANGVPDVQDIDSGTHADRNANGVPDVCEPLPDHVRAVRAGATGAGDGRTWRDAFSDLQAALSAVDASGGVVTELWVAQGTYRPAGPGGSRTSTFQLRPGLAIYGGFAGQELERGQRDFRKHRTVLCGDLKGDDAGFANTSDNCYHVVTTIGFGINMVLDGVTLSAGNANGMGAAGYGGGAYIDLGRPALANCTFVRNQAKLRGGALYAQNMWGALFENCTYTNNRCDTDGGAVFLLGSDLELVNCTFEGNHATRAGGAIYAMSGSNPVIRFSTITGNHAGKTGGALTVVDSLLTSSADLVSCILWGNSAPEGAELAIAADPYAGATSLRARYSNIQGGQADVYVGANSTLIWDEDNIDRDPRLTVNGRSRVATSQPAGSLEYLPPFDRDGEPRIGAAGAAAGSDLFIDTDQDGLPDAWEVAFGLDPETADSNSNGIPDGDEDVDEDGLTSWQEFAVFGSHPSAAPIYVDTVAGSDAHDGSAAVLQGGGVGPKRTIQAGLNLARDGDTVLVLPGFYAGPGNRNLDFAGKSVVVKATQGADATHIVCGSQGRAVDPQKLFGASAALVGFAISGGAAGEGGGLGIAEARLLIVDCVLAGNQATMAGGGLHAQNGNLMLSGLSLGANQAPAADAGRLVGTKVQLEGVLGVTAGGFDLLSSRFEGPGIIDLGPAARFRVTGTTANATATRLRAGLTGSGMVVIDPGQTLVVGGQGYLELRDVHGNAGQVEVKGTLIVEDQASVRHTRVNVKAASVQTVGEISHNELGLAGALVSGGQFFVQDQASITHNSIFSQGDRYLDLDPDPAGPHPHISHNTIHVLIHEDATFPAGTLLELRARDHDCGTAVNPACSSGAFAASGSAGFTADPSENWVLETLEILPDARLNLTNRPGFRYQENTMHPETVYVRTLILHEHAVLNTALQSLYYETLIQHPDSQIVDEPLLGFSLGVIRMDDPTPSPFNEFDIRIHSRLRDPQDIQPLPPTPPLEGRVELLPNARAPGNGVMEMATRAPGKQSASSVSAKGTFARAGDEDITITFEYSFRQVSDNTVLNVYLSDAPHAGRRIFKVAELRPPAAGSPGGVGSSQYAWFSGEFPRVVPGVYELNFTRGTYIELELRGVDACVRIDEFDPWVVCEGPCGTFDRDSAATHLDYLILLAESGQPVWVTGKNCLDLSRDGYVDLADAMFWDVIYNSDIQLCPFAESARAAAAPDPRPVLGVSGGDLANLKGGQGPRLVVAGKPVHLDDGMHPDQLYGISATASWMTSGQPLACADSLDCRHGVSRLVVNARGEVHVVHGVHGVIRADTGEVIVAPAVKTWQGRTVTIGLHDANTGTPLTDAAFSPMDAAGSFIYVAPVTVTVPASGTIPLHTYRAVAKLQLVPGSQDYSVAAVFGVDPWLDTDPCSNCTPTVPDGHCRSLCDYSGIRELAIDAAGNLFVITALETNHNDWVLLFDEMSPTPGLPRARVRLSSLFENTALSAPRSPSMALVSPRDANRLFLAASVSDADSLITPIYRFDLDPASGSLTFSGVVDVEHPAPQPVDGQIGDLSVVTSLQMGRDGSLYVLGFSAPRYGNVWLDIDEIFTIPTLAVIPPEVDWSTDASQAVTVTSMPLAGSTLALPLSAVLIPELPGDLNDDGTVDAADLLLFEQCATGPTLGPADTECTAADLDGDGDVDQTDFGMLQRMLILDGH